MNFKMKVLATISTKGRYFTTLPLAIQSVAFQTEKPDALYLFDDNDEPLDLLKYDLYKYLLMQLDIKGIQFKLFFGRKSGQHFNHQWANEIAKEEGFDAIWRLDDDTAPEPKTLEVFKANLIGGVGAIGSSILTPPIKPTQLLATGDIRYIKIEPNIQWGIITELKEVDHLHCSYLHRVGISDYNLNLSRVAHREETLHTWGFRRAGYKCWLIPSDWGCITWHYKNSEGGIRSSNNINDYVHDESIFESELQKDGVSVNWKLVVLDNGFGDHWCFKHILPKLKLKHKNIMIACCYPDVFNGDGVEICSIQHIKDTFGDIDKFNIYKFMDQSYHRGGLISAFEKMYL